MIVLNNDQQNKLIQQYVELVVDNMDRKTMEEWITDELIFQFGKLTKEELKEEVGNFDEGLFDYVICYGVAQHTPNPDECYNICVKNGVCRNVQRYIKRTQ